MRPKVLWIEDQAYTDLVELTAPVHASAKYELSIASNASEALRRLLRSEFTAVIVDVRIPPGDDPKWIRYHAEFDAEKMASRLGLALLYCLLKPDQAPIALDIKIPPWIASGKDRFGILTVESPSEIKNDREALGIQMYRQKTERTPRTVLLDMIEKIITAQVKLGA